MAATPSPCDSSASASNKKWNNLRNILERDGPFCKTDFTPSPDILDFLQNTAKILVIGAGGLGCELLKDLAMMGFGDLHVIDMDTIELSNLNRQFLFRRCDIGSPKAECAARFINQRISTCSVTPYFAKIQDFDDLFYTQFHVIVCGLDSIVARRWINSMINSLVTYQEDGSVDPQSVIPLIDGGTEGFKGNARVILPSLTACVECTLDLFPPQVTYPLCTIASKPRLPEHCVEYVKIIQWDKESPFNCALDGDDPQHISWVYEKALDRANKHNITGVTYRLVQGVVKNIIPAVASTNAAIAAACANEVFKMASNCYECMSNYMNFNDLDGIYTYTYAAEKNEECLVCSNAPQTLNVGNPYTTTLDDVIHMLCDSPKYQMKSPGITTIMYGKNKTLHMSSVGSIAERTRANLTMSLYQLGLRDGQQVMVSDATSPRTITMQLKYNLVDVEMN
uniref:NEDD8-activating enzyme E1 catalytic subunit n=1 Tax=Glossina pallidipes TaxID=7398 RepID=A0A1B0AI27_GLOPL